ncbi:MAG: CBS domain-containing protein [Nitrosopumilus sp.]|nr:CBS domain-containing protein [Nitrosopumilus sp.]MDH3515442.1 CBS domain-containing protein [Nitrosopumilus sp.]MDH3564257.1 CBS domain-containing protein [Nitrosopumilus sp.]MDH5416604.1 CBS domain-containing protein [Nitrosopumilus sp.]MDH5555129.1 CBS domain-containing protein [Nitrosopumilus sp.]
MSKSKIPVSVFMIKNIATISPLNTVEDAAKIFYEKNITSLMVMQNNELVGLVTEKDLVTSVLVFDNNKDTQIKDIMTSSIVSVNSDISVINAANLMIEKNIHKLPVMEDGKLVGLISATDLIVVFSMSNEDDLVKIFGTQLGL